MISKITIARSVEESEFHFRPLSLVCRAKYQGRTYLCPGGLVKSYDFPIILFKGNLKVYYKVRQLVITKCDSYFITKCDKCYYKVRQVLQSTSVLLQSATGITKCDDYYKVRQNRVVWGLYSEQWSYAIGGSVVTWKTNLFLFCSRNTQEKYT